MQKVIASICTFLYFYCGRRRTNIYVVSYYCCIILNRHVNTATVLRIISGRWNNTLTCWWMLETTLHTANCAWITRSTVGNGNEWSGKALPSAVNEEQLMELRNICYNNRHVIVVLQRYCFTGGYLYLCYVHIWCICTVKL